LLTETDGPIRFFKEPFAGRTTPAFIPAIIEAFARIKNAGVEEVAEHILRNFGVFFDVKLKG
jgi:Tat protein secretion system quality control protein TatD with DNase activity